MSGFEIVGVVFGAVPLLLKIGQHYEQQTASVMGAISVKAHARATKEFINQFYWGMYEMKTLVEQLLRALPGVSEAKISNIIQSGITLEKLFRDPEVREAILILFPTSDDQEPLQRLMEEVGMVFAELIESNSDAIGISIGISADNAKQGTIYRTLQGFHLGPAMANPYVFKSYRKRVKFFKKKSKRDAFIKDLEIWNSRLRKVVLDCEGKAKRHVEVRNDRRSIRSASAGVLNPLQGPSKHRRKLSNKLFRTLQDYWPCSCPSKHEARFSLANCFSPSPSTSQHRSSNNPFRNAADDALSFDFLVSRPDSFNHQLIDVGKPNRRNARKGNSTWHGCSVIIRAVMYLLQHEPRSVERYADPFKSDFHQQVHKKQFVAVCDTMKQLPGNDRNIHLFLSIEYEESGPRHCVWQEFRSLSNSVLRPGATNHPATRSTPSAAISFEELLNQGVRPKPPLLVRRRLALLFAYSMLQLYESPWTSRHWNKDNIHFLYDPVAQPDLAQPFLTTLFDDFSIQPEDYSGVFHGNLGILKLGILLVELEKWRRIEHYRTDADMLDGQPTASTDLFVSGRILDVGMRSCHAGYRNAVRACLETPWVPAGSGKLSMEDEVIRECLLRDVIRPLEREIEWGSKELERARGTPMAAGNLVLQI